jgi:hypothetical protein
MKLLRFYYRMNDQQRLFLYEIRKKNSMMALKLAGYNLHAFQ